MFAPGQRIYHPETGEDCTADVIEELLAMGRHNEPVILEREQAEIARIAGQTAENFSFGHQIGQIHEEVFDHWVAREGLAIWKDKSFLKKFFADNPACKVTGKGTGVKIAKGARVTRICRDAVTGRTVSHPAIFGTLTRPGRGRWATT